MITIITSEKCKCEKYETVVVVIVVDNVKNSQWNYFVAVNMAILTLNIIIAYNCTLLLYAKALKRNKWMKMKWKRFQFVGVTVRCCCNQTMVWLWRCGWNSTKQMTNGWRKSKRNWENWNGCRIAAHTSYSCCSMVYDTVVTGVCRAKEFLMEDFVEVMICQ